MFNPWISIVTFFENYLIKLICKNLNILLRLYIFLILTNSDALQLATDDLVTCKIFQGFKKKIQSILKHAPNNSFCDVHQTGIFFNQIYLFRWGKQKIKELYFIFNTILWTVIAFKNDLKLLRKKVKTNMLIGKVVSCVRNSVTKRANGLA